MAYMKKSREWIERDKRHLEHKIAELKNFLREIMEHS